MVEEVFQKQTDETEFIYNSGKENVVNNSSYIFSKSLQDNIGNAVTNDSVIKFIFEQGLNYCVTGNLKKAVNCFQILLKMDTDNIRSNEHYKIAQKMLFNNAKPEADEMLKPPSKNVDPALIRPQTQYLKKVQKALGNMIVGDNFNEKIYIPAEVKNTNAQQIVHPHILDNEDTNVHPTGILTFARDLDNMNDIISTVHEPLVVLDTEFNVILTNHTFQQLFKVKPEIMNGKSLFDLYNRQWDIPKLHELLEKILIKNNTFYNFKIEHYFPSLGERTLLINARRIQFGQDKTKTERILLAIEDITTSVRAEEEMKMRLMRFRLDEGKFYLVKEPVPQLSIEGFKDLLKVGYHGLVISRMPEKDFKRKVNNDGFEFIWLAEKGEKKNITQKIIEIEHKIETLPRKNVILIDRVDYLIFKNGFQRTLSFIQHLNELAYLKGNIVIISIDPSTLNEQELRLLEKEGAQIETRLERNKVPVELFKLLKFIYHENVVGVKPSFSSLAHELDISRPTVRKRIRYLVSSGHIVEIVKGRTKLVELTEMGRNLFGK